MAKVSPIQSNFNGGEVSPLLYGRPDLAKYQTGLRTCKNFIPLLQGPVERRPGTAHIVEVKTSATSTRLLPFQFSTEQAYVLEFGNTYIRFIKDRGQIESGGSPVEVTTTYATADLFQLKYAQSADVLYIAHPSYKPRKLERSSDTSWSISDIVFEDGPYLNTNATETTLTLGGTTGSVSVTASAVTGINNDAGFAATDVGRLIRWKDAAANWTWLTITAFTSTTVVTATISGEDASATTATVDWRLGVWSDTTGYPSCVTFHQNRLAFAGPTDFPQRIDASVSSDFENFAPTDADGTVTDDAAIATSLSADNVNSILWMTDDEKGLIVGTVGGEWIVRPNDNGGVLTPSNIQGTRSSAYGSANITPVRAGRAVVFVQRALRKLRELSYVFEDDGYRAPDMTLIAEHITKTGIVSLAYQSEPQSVVWMNLTDGTLIGMTYDRNMEVLGFHKHVVGGFSDSFSATQAKVESVCTIPNPEGTADELYMVVNRYINGGTKRYIEYLKPFWDSSNDPEEAFFVDSGLTLDDPKTITGITQASPGVVTAASHGFSNGNVIRIKNVQGMTEVNGMVYVVANQATNTFELTDRDGNNIDTSAFTAYETGGEVRERVTTVTGLTHLEGQTVAVLTEGAAHPRVVVSSGSITLTREASEAQVGLPYESDFETLRQHEGSRDGTAQGKTVRIHRVFVRLYQTLGGKFGPTSDSLDPIVLREGGDDMDTAVGLFQGDFEIEWDGDYGKNERIFIRQDQPLPMTIQAIKPQMYVQDR
eukprot:GHVU01059678.1.p1 GENE.GHVU01059678.1~~GHVU01059678.1.p1  ORF type:complete len:765 (+),score=100.02 GHVU01059678.1:453-2747(+)